MASGSRPGSASLDSGRYKIAGLAVESKEARLAPPRYHRGDMGFFVRDRRLEVRIEKRAAPFL